MLERLTGGREQLVAVHDLVSQEAGDQTKRPAAELTFVITVFVFSHVQRHNALVTELSTTHGTCDLDTLVSIDRAQRACATFSEPQVCTLSLTLLVGGEGSKRPEALLTALTVVNLGA
ncbi:hypothetical protein EYF80_013512 [Liparis tanakae]|uniref:Uncharacterized protein n=1 Tax=Liparis tanakae TaxID=230148 RepID=A0A4Z2IFN4_9TELE|nr:hypothetical protein EYF80_013512 [Liparis tanakae]